MFEFYDNFFFGTDFGKKSLAEIGIRSKKWAALNTFYKLIDLLLGRFDYNLPDTMDARFLELCLIVSGCAYITNYEGEVINLRKTFSNPISRYGYDNTVQLVDYMGKNYGTYIPNNPGNVMPDTAVIYGKKKMTVPEIFEVKEYAERLTNLKGSINSCVMNMRGATIIQCSKEQKKPIQDAFKDAADGVPVILSFTEFEGGLQVEPTIITNPQIPNLLASLQEAYDKTLAEFLTGHGINSNGIINKLSGVSGIELQQNAQSTEIALNNVFNARKEGLKDASKMFGQKMSVELAFTNIVPDDTMKKEDNDNQKGGDKK